MEFTNAQVVKMLREVAAAYAVQKKGNIFQIRAYEEAADVIDQSTAEIHDLWKEGKLDQVPGVGESLQAHLDELFRTGKVKHWEEVKKGLPEVFFEALEIPGIGPKTALKLVELGISSIEDLKGKIKSGELTKKGFSAKIAEKIMEELRKESSVKSGRMLLPYAFTQAEKIINYLKDDPNIKAIDALGSLRRMVATVGDLDFAIASEKPKEVVERIISMPGVSRVVDKGETKVTIMLTSGIHADFLIVDPCSYGALLQHFTGSKSHNIHLRTIAEKKGLSLSEYGVKNVKAGKIEPTETEKKFYGLLDMEVPPPEIREDTGEIEAALRQAQGKPGLPHLVELKDIKGDLHLHSNFPLESSHGPGADSIEEIAKTAKDLKYAYIGISDHSPSISNHTPEQIISLIKEKSKKIAHINYSEKGIRVLNLLEVDIHPDGALSVPDEGLKLLDFALAGAHSVHNQSKAEMTKRIIKALSNPYVKVLTHPTNRILNERGSSEADWTEIFKFAATNNKALEINSFPNRLDLFDVLIREAKSFGVKFVIDTDSHTISQLDNMRFGVAMARRGWLEASDVVNTWDYQRLTEWCNIKS